MRILLLVLVLATVSAAAPADVEELTEHYDDGTPKIVREVRRDASGAVVNHGAYTSWYPNGKKASEGRYENGRRRGKWIFRWENGRRKAVGPYADGRRTGTWKLYREGGGLEAEGEYREDHRHGPWTYYDAKKRIDPRRSGTYRWVSWAADTAFLQGEGELFEGEKSGPWVYRWPNGATMATCSYAGGLLHGELAFHRPDGTFEPALFSGVYRAGRRVAPLDAPPSAESGDAAPFDHPLLDPDTPALVEEWLTGEEEPAIVARARLVAGGRAAFPAVLNRLVRCDLARPADRAIALHLHTLLRELCGGAGYAWDEADTPDARARCTLAVQRWQIAWIALQDAPGPWAIDFPFGGGESMAPEDTLLFALPLPVLLASPTAAPPSALDAPPDVITGEGGARFGPRRHVRAAGGAGTEAPLAEALAWLVAHQEKDGHWDCARYGGYELFDVGVTAQATLALLGDGSTLARGPYRDAVIAAVNWLLRQQNPTTGQIVSSHPRDGGGLETGPQPIYEHALAMQALAEAAYSAKSPLLENRLRRALAHLLAVRDEAGTWDFAGGRFTGDCSVTVSVVLPLRTVTEMGIPVDQGVFDTIARRLDEITASDGHARLPDARPLGPEERRYAPDRGDDVTGRVLLARFFLGQGSSPAMDAQVDWLLAHPPRWEAEDETLDLHALHDGSYAMFQVGGKAWETWNRAMKIAVLGAQAQEGDERGSWDPLGPYGRGGGRVLSTALMAQTLLVYSRYARMNEPR